MSFYRFHCIEVCYSRILKFYNIGFCEIKPKNITEKLNTHNSNDILDKEQFSYDYLLDTLRLSLKD